MRKDCQSEILGKIACNLLAITQIIIISFTSQAAPAPKTKPLLPVSVAPNGKLTYSTDAKGNRVPDYSFCGFKASEETIPNVPVRLYVPAIPGDETERIQSAIDYVSALPLDKKGLRGAILLGNGLHTVEGSLLIRASGVVLRGVGNGKEGTILLASGLDRRTFIRIQGGQEQPISAAIKITDAYVPVNASWFNVAETLGLAPGDWIRIQRPSTQNWIDTLKCTQFGGGISALGWKPGTRDLFWDRKITALQDHRISLDAPLTTALDTTFGGGFVTKIEGSGLINQVGIENMMLRSSFDVSNPKDEAHSWMAITMNNCLDGWIRQVNFEHFAGSAVAIFETARRITVEDCKSLAPISEIGGQRRNSFFTCGQQTLFQRCYAENGYHDFSVGACAAGPNAFVQCESYLPYSFSGTIGSWASGVLFDVVNVDGNALSYLNRGQDGMGSGWSAANSMFWQCSAARVDNWAPPTANNWAYGTWAQFSGDGYWYDSNNQIKPRSLFYAQLADRTGKQVDAQARLYPMATEASTSPSVEMAAALTQLAKEPLLTLSSWIDQAAQANPIPVAVDGVKTADQLMVQKSEHVSTAPPLQLRNGWLVRGTTVVSGKKHSVPWWNTNPIQAVTRFVPGRIGKTCTDDLNELTDWMLRENILSLEQNYGLWYDRRRDDHERIRRMDGDVWPPFYELPFARSGKETAWDGLSKYDLTKYNSWYWIRLKQFADLADQKGLILVHQHYFQHNIIEAGAHFADFPWRPANNINGTGFPEPVPYAGDKRIFMAEQFYDSQHPVRRPIHEAYIRQCLENFRENSGVIQYIGEEFTGPFHFVRFWLETVQKWEKEKGRKELIGLAVTKDVQDSVLANPTLAAVVDLIDIRYWFYRENGTAYAPQGGLNLAPRQHARLVKPGKASFEQVYRAVLEYHNRFPDKAVTYSADSYDSLGWAVLMAGGSLPVLPFIRANGFLESVSGMTVHESSGKSEYLLQNNLGERIIYSRKGNHSELNLRDLKGKYVMTLINPSDGSIQDKPKQVAGGNVIPFESPSGDVVLWLMKLK